MYDSSGRVRNGTRSGRNWGCKGTHRLFRRTSEIVGSKGMILRYGKIMRGVRKRIFIEGYTLDIKWGKVQI